MNARIRRVIADNAGLSVDVRTLADDADLFLAGMSSHASLEVMLALENEFDLEFPDRMLDRAVFESIASLEAALMELTSEAAA